MTVTEWLTATTNTLEGIESKMLDAELLLCDELGQSRAWIRSHDDYMVPDNILARLKEKVMRRQTGEPLAYIRGFSEFYGRRFTVNKHVLVPRPESEMMIELVLSSRFRVSSNEMSIIDIGTGCGVLGITVQLELEKLRTLSSELKTYLIDIDPDCLKVAATNTETYSIKTSLLQGNLLAPYFSELRTKNSELLILANLPYVPENYEINAGAEHEPKLALFSGADGLDHYRELFRQIGDLRSEIGEATIYCESLEFQHDELRKIAENYGFQQTNEKVLIQVFSRKDS